MTCNTGQTCPVVQLYCSEQIAIPETFPNILKTYAKAAIRTQPYDILQWSAAYFRCLSNNAPPPAKIRLERDCRQGCLTKGYLKVLIAQVGKGFFISRCLLQERWKALCLPEDDLLKLLSICRMLNWPQVHWLKFVAVMIASLNQTPNDTMVMVCELLTDDVDGGLARIPYWMFKICYTFVAKLDCSQELCFVNGQMVLSWGDLEEPTPMNSLPRVLSATVLKDTIIASCKAKYVKPFDCQFNCTYETSSNTASSDFMINSKLDDPKELLTKCEDFDTIMLLLQDSQENRLTEDDFNGPHYVSEKQLSRARKLEDKICEERQHQCEKTEEQAKNFLQQEAFQMLREVGPPWTWLHKFTETNNNTTSYNFIDQESIMSDANLDVTSEESFDLVKEEPVVEDVERTSSKSYLSEEEIAEKKESLEDLKSLLEGGKKEKKYELDNTSSVVSFLKAEETGVLQRAGEHFKPTLNLKEIICCLERADANGIEFKDIPQLMRHIHLSTFGNVNDFPPRISRRPESMGKQATTPHTSYAGEMLSIYNIEGSIEIPREWAETIPKQINIPPCTAEREPPPQVERPKTPEKEEMSKIIESTVGIPPEQSAKMPKFCFAAKDSDELILGLVPLVDPVEVVEEHETGSELTISDCLRDFDGDGFKRDDEDLLDFSDDPPKFKLSLEQKLNQCCVNAPTLTPKPYEMPQVQFHCSIQPMPGIGAAVSQQTIDEFLAYLRVRSRSQMGLINPRNFREEKCPYMVDTIQHDPK